MGHIPFWLIVVLATAILSSTQPFVNDQKFRLFDFESLLRTKEDAVQLPKRKMVKVIKVIDGDTIEIEGGVRVRYIGIDAPEMSPVECYAKQSLAKNKDLVFGKEVTLEKDVSETDRYGRLLRYVWVDGQLINEVLVSQGFAVAASYPPDLKYQDKLEKAEEEARNEGRGLWGDACNSPTPTKNPKTPQTGQRQKEIVANKERANCDCNKTCLQISSCDEAQYQLNDCGCRARDNDGDGIACDGAPLNCQ